MIIIALTMLVALIITMFFMLYVQKNILLVYTKCNIIKTPKLERDEYVIKYGFMLFYYTLNRGHIEDINDYLRKAAGINKNTIYNSSLENRNDDALILKSEADALLLIKYINKALLLKSTVSNKIIVRSMTKADIVACEAMDNVHE